MQMKLQNWLALLAHKRFFYNLRHECEKIPVQFDLHDMVETQCWSFFRDNVYLQPISYDA